ncbi:hypothetical protein OH76DRAFT_1400363 [Lentinus brumalis]|uniref:Secreted protein n=1 Tax=Lentinus brumalis TaxID=2498619 RepID=A0A371DJ60_9APHY|nr:hypothetical protein OH76DRAFT_1400363 [Polyporus brumalis]
MKRKPPPSIWTAVVLDLSLASRTSTSGELMHRIWGSLRMALRNNARHVKLGKSWMSRDDTSRGTPRSTLSRAPIKNVPRHIQESVQWTPTLIKGCTRTPKGL